MQGGIEGRTEQLIVNSETVAAAVAELGWQGALLKDKLLELRKSREMFQTEFAQKIPVISQSVSDWERGGRIPTLKELIEIGDSFDLPDPVRLAFIGLSGKLDSFDLPDNVRIELVISKRLNPKDNQ